MQRFEYYTRRRRKDSDIIDFLNDINDEIQDKGFSSEQNSSKRKKEKKKIEKTDTNEGLLQRFREYMKDHNEKKEVIKFVNLINWEYLQKKGHLTKKEEEEIIVFARYFMKNLYPLLEEDFIKEWGDVPYIVQLSAELEAMQIMDIR